MDLVTVTLIAISSFILASSITARILMKKIRTMQTALSTRGTFTEGFDRGWEAALNDPRAVANAYATLFPNSRKK